MKLRYLYWLIIIFSLSSTQLEAQGSTCNDIEPFCASDEALIWQNTSDGSTAEGGIDYGCLGSQPNPAWFYIRISEAGDLLFLIEQSTQSDFSVIDLDVDFIAWGPFTQAEFEAGICGSANLNPSTQVPGQGQPAGTTNSQGCSYLPDDVEAFNILGADVGEIYVLLVTNFSQQPGFIRLQQTNAGGGAGTGLTDCSIVNDLAFCEGDVTDLDATTTDAVTYEWFEDGTPLAETGPILMGVTAPSAIYTCNAISSSGQVIEEYEFNVLFATVPVANPAQDLIECTDLANFDFDIKENDDDILGGQAAGDYTISYHETQADADAGANPLASPYTNTSNPQTIYARIENNVNPECYDTTTFELIISGIDFNDAIDNMEVCDTEMDGDMPFDLLSKNGEITASTGLPSSDIIITYHDSMADADGDMNALASPYTNTANPQTIYVRVEDRFNSACYGVITFDLIVNLLPTVNVVTDLEECDDDTDGLVEFTLTDKDAEVLGGQTDIVVTYYETLAEAQSGANALASPYINTSNPQTVYIRLENTITGCVNTNEMDLVVNPLPVGVTPTPLEACDDDNDGFTMFDLTLKDAEAIGGTAGLGVTWYGTQANAENDVDALTSPYTNVVPNTQTVYGRVADITTGCFDVVELILIVNPLPTVSAVTDYELCDDNNPGDEVELFDLTTKVAEIEAGQVGMVVSFYETEADAQAQTGALASPYANMSNPQTIWYVIENATTNCSDIGSFDLIVNELPQITAPTALEVCDDNVPDGITAIDLTLKNTEITGGNTNYTVSYHISQADADASANALPIPYTNVSNPQTVFVRVEDITTNCYTTTTLELVVEQAPIANVPTPLEFCDPDNDGIGVFTLTDAEPEIIGTQTGLTVTYHETLANAENNVDAVSSPYVNVNPYMQTIYVRVESATIATDCATIVELELIVHDTPVVPDPIEDYILCDDDYDGFTQFNLTTKDAEIYGSQNPALYDLTYHVTQSDADTGNAPITAVGNYTNLTNPQTIYVRLYDPLTDCFTTGSFDLIVELPPLPVQPTPYELCDDDVADERTSFDLTLKDAEITGGNGSWIVQYYETQADAQADTNMIDPATAYTNIVNPQTVYVRVVDTDTDCFAFITMTLRVLPNPTPGQDPDDLELCDDINPGDGVEEFDLTQNEDYIINFESGVTTSYYESLEDAEAGVNSIATPATYTNTIAGGQTIYVRVTNGDDPQGTNGTGCYTIVSFDVIVHPLPEVVAVTDMIQCEDNTDGFWPFVLTDKDAEVLNGQNPTEFTVSYHTSVADAQAGMNALVSPYMNMTNPEQIFVRIENNTTGCAIATQSFFIEVQEAAEANSDGEPIVYQLCDDEVETDGDPSNDSAQFDLTTLNDAVLDGQDATNYTVSYYANQTDAALQVNPLPSLYENVINPQTIFIRVDNDTTADDICFAVTDATLEVLPLPIFTLDEEYILCVNLNGTEEIAQPVLDTGLSETDYSFQWQLNGTDIAGATGSSYMPTQGGVYTVAVGYLSTGCVAIGSTTVIESEPPQVVAAVTSLAFAGNHIIEVTVEGEGVYEYSLDGGPYQASNVFENVTAGIHEVTVRDINGCGIGTDSVLVIDYPLYFTPNNDGFNDTWNIVGIATQPNAKIYIFDRYGKLLKQLSPTGDGWNGTYNGVQMPSNDYWFVVEYNEPIDNSRREFKAHFSLRR